MAQLCDYKVKFKGEKQHIAQLLGMIAQRVDDHDGNSWQYRAIMLGLGDGAHYGLSYDFDSLSDTDTARFISAVAFIQEESQVSMQYDFFRELFRLVPELECRAEVESGGSLGIEVHFSPPNSGNVAVTLREYDEKSWYDTLLESPQYRNVKLRGLNSVECSERIEYTQVGDILSQKQVVVHDDERRIGLFTPRGQVGYLPHDFSLAVETAMTATPGDDAAVVTVSSVTPVSQRRKGSKYGLLEVNIDFSVQVMSLARKEKDLAELEKQQVYDSNIKLLKDYADNLPELEGVTPKGLAVMDDNDSGSEPFSFTHQSGEPSELKVLGVPEQGKAVQCGNAVNLSVPYGVVYWWEEGLIHFARPTEMTEGYHDGIFTLPENFARQWEWHVRTVDAVTSDFDSAAAWSAMQERNLEDDEFSATPHTVEHREQTLYILTKEWGETSNPDTEPHLSTPAVLSLYHYKDGMIYSITGRYTCYDGDRGLPADILGILRSVTPAQADSASAEESALRKFGDMAGGAGNINAFKLLERFQNRELYLNPETDLEWNGTTHIVKNVSFYYISSKPIYENGRVEVSTIIDGVRHVIDSRSEPPENAEALTEGVSALCKHLAQTEGLTIPRNRIHPNLLKVLPTHDFTYASMFGLATQHSLVIASGKQAEGNDTYFVPLDINVKNGIPKVHDLIGRFISALRSFNGLTDPFAVTFSNTRNLDSEITDIIGVPVEGAAGEGNITMHFDQFN